MKLNEYKDYLVKFLKDYNEKTHTKGYVFGLSGGIDSAVVAGLLKQTKKNVLAVIIPISSSKNDIKDAISVAESLKIKYVIVNLTSTYKKLIRSIKKSSSLDNELSKANTKARLRMTCLYALGQQNNLLVCGTDNYDEYYTGYFTKFGDGAYDIMPLRYLVKNEIKELAKLLKIDQKIIDKTPSAGLLNNQSDEKEMGVTYQELDAYLLGKKISKEAKNKIESLHNKTNHKRELAVLPKEYNRK